MGFEGFRSESELVSIVASRLRECGFFVLRNFVVLGMEIDVVGVEFVGLDPYVYVFEVKRRPRNKLVKQLRKRMSVADYVYAVVPHYLYSWALKRVDPWAGIAVVMGEELKVLRMGRYLGRGRRFIEATCLDGGGYPWCSYLGSGRGA